MRRRWLRVLVVAAVVGLGAAVTVRVARTLADANAEMAGLAAYLAQMASELRTTKADSDLLVDVLAVLDADDLRRVPLESDPGASRVFVGRKGILLLARGFSRSRPGSVFHVWIETRSADPASVSTFLANPFGLATVARLVDVPVEGRILVTEESEGPVGRPSEPLLRSAWW